MNSQFVIGSIHISVKTGPRTCVIENICRIGILSPLCKQINQTKEDWPIAYLLSPPSIPRFPRTKPVRIEKEVKVGANVIIVRRGTVVILLRKNRKIRDCWCPISGS